MRVWGLCLGGLLLLMLQRCCGRGESSCWPTPGLWPCPVKIHVKIHVMGVDRVACCFCTSSVLRIALSFCLEPIPSIAYVSHAGDPVWFSGLTPLRGSLCSSQGSLLCRGTLCSVGSGAWVDQLHLWSISSGIFVLESQQTAQGSPLALLRGHSW